MQQTLFNTNEKCLANITNPDTYRGLYSFHKYWGKEPMLAVYWFIGSLKGTPRVRARRFVAAFLLRITHGLRSGADEPRLRGYEKRSRGYVPLCVFLRPHFCAAGNLRFPSSRRKNAANLSVRCNGPHGETVSDFLGDSPHYGYHTHTILPETTNSMVPMITQEYGSFYDAISYFIKKCNITGVDTIFPFLRNQEKLQKELEFNNE